VFKRDWGCNAPKMLTVLGSIINIIEEGRGLTSMRIFTVRMDKIFI
jgi:hypothetical protein